MESYGVKLAMMPLPLSSVEIDKAEYPNIMLGKTPERDRDIDDICQMVTHRSMRRGYTQSRATSAKSSTIT